VIAQSASLPAGNANERAETLSKSNLLLQAEVLRLKKENEPRRLTGSQKEALRRLLEGRPTPIVIVSRLLDPESSDLADDLASALNEAHWQPQRINDRISRKYGVSVGTVSGTTGPEIKLLSDAFDRNWGGTEQRRDIYG